MRRRPTSSDGGALARRGDGGVAVARHGGHRVPRVVHAAGGEQQRRLDGLERVLRRHGRRRRVGRPRRPVLRLGGHGRQGGRQAAVAVVVVGVALVMMVVVLVGRGSVPRVGDVHVIIRGLRIVLGRPALPRRRRRLRRRRGRLVRRGLVAIVVAMVIVPAWKDRMKMEVSVEFKE